MPSICSNKQHQARGSGTESAGESGAGNEELRYDTSDIQHAGAKEAQRWPAHLLAVQVIHIPLVSLVQDVLALLGRWELVHRGECGATRPEALPAARYLCLLYPALPHPVSPTPLLSIPRRTGWQLR